jgi:hypothetical protein
MLYAGPKPNVPQLRVCMAMIRNLCVFLLPGSTTGRYRSLQEILRCIPVQGSLFRGLKDVRVELVMTRRRRISNSTSGEGACWRQRV